MGQYDMMEILGRAFAEENLDALQSLMADDCDYVSQYAGKTMKGAAKILSHMKAVHAKVDETCAYTYKIIELESVLLDGLTLADFDHQAGMHLCRYGLLLYQHSANKPVAVVVCMIDLYEKFRSIWLCRDKTRFNVSFYGKEVEQDSPEDIPSTVVPLTTHDRHVAEMGRFFAGQAWDKNVETDMESELYSEPELTDKIVYSDKEHKIRKIWEWNVDAMYEDGKAGLLKVMIRGQAFNWYGKFTFVSLDGKRMTSLTFDFIDNFQEGLARVAVCGCGYGFVDKNMDPVVPMKYEEAENFRNGRAMVRLGDTWRFVDKKGNELELGGKAKQRIYQEVGGYSEGMCCVSILKLRSKDLAYHSDYEQIAGIWGFVNESGEEVISPQYIYADDFKDGIAIVAKGKWTIDPKWDNKYKQGCYWTEEELWGAIDKDGNEVIPFIFDEIKQFSDRTDMFMAHYGGWEDGHWGVIDNRGNWLAEPAFAGFDYESWNDLIVFDAEASNATGDDPLMGIYDLKNRKILFEPQFLDVNFCSNGDMVVEVFDQELGRTIEKIIDRTGKERFKSIYSSIFTWAEPYEVVIRDENGSRYGLIDMDGNVILPCVYDIPPNGIMHEQKRICFIENGKQGVMDYDGNIVVPAIYHEIHGHAELFLTVRVGDKHNYKEGLITPDGKTVIPALYKRIDWCRDHKHFFCCSDRCCEMYIVEDQIAAP